MILTSQMVEILRDTIREQPLTEDEFRRIKGMGLHYLSRGGLDAVTRDPAFSGLFSFRIDGELYSLCYRSR